MSFNLIILFGGGFLSCLGCDVTTGRSSGGVDGRAAGDAQRRQEQVRVGRGRAAPVAHAAPLPEDAPAPARLGARQGAAAARRRRPGRQRQQQQQQRREPAPRQAQVLSAPPQAPQLLDRRRVQSITFVFIIDFILIN